MCLFLWDQPLEEQQLKQSNIVLICVDQWRGDCLGIDGHPVVQTPFLDQLASDGVRFSRAYSSCPVCIPARAALFTGLSQRSHGRVGYEDGVPWNYPITMAGEFTRGGYQTQAVGKMHVFPERSQLGFQNVILHDGYLRFARNRSRDISLVDDYIPWLRDRLGRDADYFEHGVNCNSMVARPWDKDEYAHPTNWVVHQSIDFLRRRDPRKPFFLFMSFHRPHPPYDPPSWAFDMYADRDMPQPPIGDWSKCFAEYGNVARPDTFYGEFDGHVLNRARAGYYGHMTHIDHQINRFIETLHEFEVANNTWIAFVSDHGEMLGDHNLYRKGYPYEGSSRVPLILKGPPGVQLERGQRCDALVELRDIMPTLLDCAELPIPVETEGRSVLPLLQKVPHEWRAYLHGEHVIFGQSLQWLTDGKEKYIWMSELGREQLFDLKTDPLELHDLSAHPASGPRILFWRRILISELAGRDEGFSDGSSLICARPVKTSLSHIC